MVMPAPLGRSNQMFGLQPLSFSPEPSAVSVANPNTMSLFSSNNSTNPLQSPVYNPWGPLGSLFQGLESLGNAFNPLPQQLLKQQKQTPQQQELSKCVIGWGGVGGVGKVCLLTKGQGETLLGGLLIVAGGIGVLTGLLFIVGSLVAFEALPVYTRGITGIANRITQARQSPQIIKQAIKPKAKTAKAKATAKAQANGSANGAKKSSRYVLVPADQAPVAS